MNRELGARIRELRRAGNLTQQAVACDLGISRQKYARIENGANSITLDLLAKVSELFSVTVSDITSVLDRAQPLFCRNGENAQNSANRAMDMLELFYANKHLYERIAEMNR